MIKSLESESSTPMVLNQKRYWTMWYFYGRNESHWPRSRKARVEDKLVPCGKNWRMFHAAVLMCKWLSKWVTYIPRGLFVREKHQNKLLWMSLKVKRKEHWLSVGKHKIAGSKCLCSKQSIRSDCFTLSARYSSTALLLPGVAGITPSQRPVFFLNETLGRMKQWIKIWVISSTKDDTWANRARALLRSKVKLSYSTQRSLL